MRTSDFSMPSPEWLREQAAWLAPARARLLRRADIARRHSVLDLACGPATVTAELLRRSGGSVVALDRQRAALHDHAACFGNATRVCGQATQLPFPDRAFDLVFCQFALMWLDAPAALREIRRVLQPDGVLVAIEPDYGGLIEDPPEIALGDLWRAALRRAGADPLIGRRLPRWLHAAGFAPQTDLLERLAPPSPWRFAALRGLPLTADETAALCRAEEYDTGLGDAVRVVHLPLFLLVATVIPQHSAGERTCSEPFAHEMS